MPPKAPGVQSFVIRFIENRVPAAGSPDQAHWRGVIVHVQTNEERGFSDFADAVAFIARHVCIGEFVFKGGENAESSDQRD